MAFKIAFCAGHGGSGSTPGKRTPDGEYEWDFNNKVALAFENEMLKYEGVELLRTDDPTGKRDVSLKERTDKANNWGADIYISFHHNAFRGKWESGHTGTETYHYNGSTEGKKLADLVHDAAIKAYGLRNRGLKTNNLHITRETRMPAVLLEGGFMDSTIDIKKLRDDKVLENAGRNVAKAVAEYGNIKKKEEPEKQEPEKSESTYTGNSIVDYLNFIGESSSFNNRKKLAKKYGMKNYSGTASQNTELLNRMRDAEKAPSKPKTNLKIDGYWGKETTKALQQHFSTIVDGVISKPSMIIRAIQNRVGAKVDGYLGKETITKMQKHFGTPQDGVISKPSLMVKEMQKRLNQGKF